MKILIEKIIDDSIKSDTHNNDDSFILDINNK